MTATTINAPIQIIQTIAPLVGGKGGGRPDSARGAGKDAAKIDEALAQADQRKASLLNVAQETISIQDPWVP